MIYKNTKVVLNPSTVVFGDGTHDSTKIVLDALYKANPKDKSVIDVGTGTGIQSIFAKKWGAKDVLAVDIEYGTILTARENFKLNNVDVKSMLNIYNENLEYKADITVTNFPLHCTRKYLKMAPMTMADDGVLIFSWDRQFNLMELDLSNYKIVDHLEGIDWDSYIVKLK